MAAEITKFSNAPSFFRLAFLLTAVQLIATCSVEAKVYRKCELVKKLEDGGVFKSFIPTFVCLSESESGMNSSSTTTSETTPVAVTSYGIFQLNNRRWCRDSFAGGDCAVKCADLLKDDLKASISCAKIRQEKAGFRDWPTFNKRCRPTNLPNIRDCN